MAQFRGKLLKLSGGNCRDRGLTKVRDQRVAKHLRFPEGAWGRAVYQAHAVGPAEAKQMRPCFPHAYLLAGF